MIYIILEPMLGSANGTKFWSIILSCDTIAVVCIYFVPKFLVKDDQGSTSTNNSQINEDLGQKLSNSELQPQLESCVGLSQDHDRLGSVLVPAERLGSALELASDDLPDSTEPKVEDQSTRLEFQEGAASSFHVGVATTREVSES